MSRAHTVCPCVICLNWKAGIVLWFTGGRCGQRGARSDAHVLSGAQAEVGAGPGRLHGNRLVWQHSEEARRFPEIKSEYQTEMWEGIQLCRTVFFIRAFNANFTFEPRAECEFWHRMAILIDEGSSGPAFSVTCSRFPRCTFSSFSGLILTPRGVDVWVQSHMDLILIF